MSAPPKPQSPAQNAAAPHDGSQDKLAEQIALVSAPKEALESAQEEPTVYSNLWNACAFTF